ncbi:MAG: PQQ-binding-like beta-propeller repeat protein [Candidatus Sabulitectum sp.]|nr:PQQ-binding-like beta-propeller repeat protein [Candidatus Sabulitectum sp.]
MENGKRRYTWILFSFFLAASALAQPMWPTFQYDNQRTGLCPYTGPETSDTLWTFTPGGGIQASSPAIGEDGTIYFGCKDGYLYAINPDGTLKWTCMTNDQVLSSPAIDADGTIYFGSTDQKLYAVEDSVTYAKVKWTFSGSSAICSPVLAGPDGTIYTDNMYSIDQDGNQNWFYPTGISGSSGGPAMSSDNNSLYIQHATAFDHYLTCLDTSGSVNWERNVGTAPMSFSFSTPTVGSDGVIYYPTGFGGPLYAINPNSTVKWKCYDIGDLRHTSAGLGDDGTIYIAGGFEQNFHSLTPSGVLSWTMNTASNVIASPIIDANGVIYIASFDTLFAINPDCSVKWALELEIYTTSTPAMDANGNVYICSGSRLYAIGPDTGFNDEPTNPSDEGPVIQISPNPFSGSTEISVSICCAAQNTELSIYDISGRLVRGIPLSVSPSSGTATVLWDRRDGHGREVEAGFYFCRFHADGFSTTGKMIVLE